MGAGLAGVLGASVGLGLAGALGASVGLGLAGALGVLKRAEVVSGTACARS